MNASKIDCEEFDWAESSSRPAGYRQTLKIGNAEYGFVWIPAGEFDMGSPESEKNRNSDETLHHVKLTKGFWMLETVVPQSLYQEVMGTNPSYFRGDDLPVECVSWNVAMDFCEELTTRLPGQIKASLPTEAQWEYSCRAGTKTAYWYGDVADSDTMNCGGQTKSVKSYASDPFHMPLPSDLGHTMPVKSCASNPWGLYDAHGNVCEWTSDYYSDYPSETVTDPKGPSNGAFYLFPVFRGGSWCDGERNCRSARRRWFSPIGRYFNLGFFVGFRFLLSCD